MRWLAWCTMTALGIFSGASLAGAGCDTEVAERAMARCTICHSTTRDGGHGIGPNRYRIMGRDIASCEDFYYSDVLGAIAGSWNAETLDRFLSDPAAFAPGTTMGFGGLTAALEREAEICQLGAVSSR